MSRHVRETVVPAGSTGHGSLPDIRRQLVVSTVGLVAVYAAGVAAFWPQEGGQPDPTVFLVLVFAPVAGAVLAQLMAGGRIRWGRPGWWLLDGLPVLHRRTGHRRRT